MTGMRYLRKTLWAVGLIIVLQLLKTVFDKVFPGATIFHRNLLSCVQVVILLWLVIALLGIALTRGKTATVKTTRKILLLLFLLVAIPEMVFTWWLHHPSQIPSFLVPTFRNYYGEVQRNIIQFDPACSVYDSSLFYTLKPSSQFVFTNYEFANTFYTNNMGLRDDDSSLSKPAIICLGDSYAMGWGVEQQKSFPELLGQLQGKKVLNAAISSYGTARELKNLYRLDTSALQYLVIQYSRNDATENTQFVQQNFSLVLSPKETYDATVNMHYWNKYWFPGKHFISMAKMYVAQQLPVLLPRKGNDTAAPFIFNVHQSALDFADMLLHSPVNFKKIKVLVTDINDKRTMNDDFLDEVKKITFSAPYKEYFNNNLITVPVAGILSKEDYYILDDHLRPSGHEKIANRLNSYMASSK